MLRRLVVAAVVLVVVSAVGLLVSPWFSSLELSNVMAELDRQDPGWRLKDIESSRKAVPDARNSALHIVAVAKLRGGQQVITPAMEKAFENLPPQVQLNEQQATLLEARFAILQKAVPEARKLEDMPEGRYPITYSEDFISTLVPHLQDAREVCELLRWDAARRVHAGDVEGALESCLALENAARSMGDEPFLISLLVRHGCGTVAVETLERTLAQGEATEHSDPILKRMQEFLTRELAEPTLVVALRGERAGLHQLIQALVEGKVSAASFKAVGKTLDVLQSIMQGQPRKRTVGSEIDATLTQLLPGYLIHQHAAVLRFATDLVEAAKLPLPQRDERFEALQKKLQGEPFLVRLSAPPLVKLREVDLRRHANLGCALAALAAERFRIAQKRWPDSLDEAVKLGFLDAIPTDPYDGKPIRLKRTPDGLVIYSISQDKIDNGGLIDRDRPSAPNTDLGFRLWDVSRRRQAANPPVLEGQ
jgi:hypothetical protein